MISLKTKILGIAALVVATIVSISALLNLNYQNQIIFSIAERNTALLTETIKGSITDAMLAGHSDEIRKIFSHITSKNMIKTLRIIDESGKVLNSANHSEIGTTAFSNALIAYRRGVQSSASLLDNRVFVSISPILNAPACIRCHESSQKVLGLLEIETSLDYVHGIVSENRKQTVIATAIIILLLVISISLLMVVYLDKPVSILINAMQRLEQGEFAHTPTFTSSKEMNLLSRHYNRMVKRLHLLMENAVKNEGELVRAQDKLEHHHETQIMNEQLEQQLREIEALNRSLVERIEEIEEANYKIADLAGELEDKNSTLERAVARLSTLHKVGLAIGSTMELGPLFHLVVRSTMETLQARIGFIALHDTETQTISISTLLGEQKLPMEEFTVPADACEVSSWVVAHRRPLLISNMADYPHFIAQSPLGFEKKTVISVPLRVKEEVIGTINVINRWDNTSFSNEDLELLTTIAGQASIAINNAKLYDEQQKTYLSTIQSLVSAIEASDSYTRGHSERVTHYSLLLAKKLDLPPERLNIIERAAILHDIGKIGIDLTLLHKKGGLSSNEIIQMREHPAIGMKILEPIGFLQDVRICIGQHHERFDGQGYPQCHGSESLLLEARILAIADAFDAMTSDRPYRKALPVAIAIAELRDHAGTQFDPELVEQFISALAEEEPADSLQTPAETVPAGISCCSV
ncbi:MAG: GAF domain-containing protein [Geobacter sp.]|nr:GAF domain-containing protein [Geobacter sp.]